MMLIIPSVAYADTVTVKFKTNTSGSEVLAQIEATKNQTTVGELKPQLADLVDMEKYI